MNNALLVAVKIVQALAYPPDYLISRRPLRFAFCDAYKIQEIVIFNLLLCHQKSSATEGETRNLVDCTMCKSSIRMFSKKKQRHMLLHYVYTLHRQNVQTSV